MTKKINTTTTPEDGEKKNLQTKNAEVLHTIAGVDNVKLDPDVLKGLLKDIDGKREKFKEVTSLEDIDQLGNEAIQSLDVSTINKCISLLTNYKDSYLNAKVDVSIQKFVEENQIEDMDEKFLALSEDMRILIAIYRSKIKKYWYSCGWWFWYYKTPTSCGGCISWRENMEKANLDHLAKYIWERQYQVPKERIEASKSNFLKEFTWTIENPTENLQKIIKIYSSKLKDCEETIQNQNAMNKIKGKNAGLTDEMILESIPWFVSHIAGQDSSNIQVDIPNKVAAYIQWTSRDSKSAWMEYGNYVAVRYNGKRKDVHIVYRDAYDSHKDDRSLCFSALDIKNIETKDNKIFVTVKASSKENSRTYTFDFPLAKEEKPWLSKEEQEKFAEIFESTKQKILIEQNKRYDWRQMPVYCLPPEMTYNNMPWWDVPYLRPTVTSEYMDKANWVWVIVIYKQIDHNAGSKRQLAREWWLIKADGSYDRVEYENMRDSERLAWKQIKMFAQEIVGKYDIPKAK